jgi:hypothetical protein
MGGLHCRGDGMCFFKDICHNDHCWDGKPCVENVCTDTNLDAWAKSADGMGSCGTTTQCTAKCVDDSSCRTNVWKSTGATWSAQSVLWTRSLQEVARTDGSGSDYYFKSDQPCIRSGSGDFSHCEQDHQCNHGGVCQIAANPVQMGGGRRAPVSCGTSGQDCMKKCAADATCLKAWVTKLLHQDNWFTKALELYCPVAADGGDPERCFYTSTCSEYCRDGKACNNGICV